MSKKVGSKHEASKHEADKLAKLQRKHLRPVALLGFFNFWLTLFAGSEGAGDTEMVEPEDPRTVKLVCVCFRRARWWCLFHRMLRT